MDVKKLQEVATNLANSAGADVILYNGQMERPFDSKFIDLCANPNRRGKVFLFLCTLGGDANVAYRIGRCLQQRYNQFTVFICGTCKSAGTLLAVGAHELVMNDHGELGPLDVQLGKKDELWEMDSGLTVLSAISTLEGKAFDLFETCFLNLKARSGGRITLKTATELASTLATGVVAPIVAQIDPMHVGEVSRAINIGIEYGNRLSSKSKNANQGTVENLTKSYPSHSFVIDREEAKLMFANVREPNDAENELIALLGYAVREPSHDPVITYLSTAIEGDTNESDNPKDTTTGSPSEGTGSGGIAKAGGDGKGAGEQSATAGVTQLPEKLKGAA